MRILYIECNMGAAGDMLLSALSELFPEGEAEKILGSINIPDVQYKMNKVSKCGVFGTHIEVAVGGHSENEHMHEHHHHHHHTTLSDIEHIIFHLQVPEKVKQDAVNVYKLIADAESKAHNCRVEEIHFHEVGAMDAVADIVGVCLLLYKLGADKVVASSVNVGGGSVKCAHGILPVPAPATAYLLRDIPVFGGDIQSELCTPTGAALIKYFASEFSSVPAMSIEKIGYGMGKKDFERANCVRAVLGVAEDSAEEISEIRCNVDDMTGEDIAFAVEQIFEAGALDVFTTAVGMKKNRPAVMITALFNKSDRENILRAVFTHTSTIGVREYRGERYTLAREEVTVNTNYGEVRAKKSSGYGVVKIKPEHDELEKLARENGIAVSDIRIIY